MLDEEFAKWLATLGVGGILAVIFYYQARKDSQAFSDKLMSLNEIERGRTEIVLNVVKENTHQTVLNTEVLRGLHKRLDKDEIERAGRREEDKGKV